MKKSLDIDIIVKRLAKPAQRAIQNEGITTIEQLSNYSEKELAELHGIGKNALNIIKEIMNKNGFVFSQKK